MLTINSESVLSTISATSGAGDTSAAVSTITTQVTVIVNYVNVATTLANALVPSKLARRQDDGLQAALTSLLTEINGISETLVADLGLSKLLALSLW